MATTRRTMRGLSPTQVFDALRDGTTYGDWVVGTRATGEVDSSWPAAGSAIHYTVGYGPLRKDGITTSTDYAPDTRLGLEAHAWPAGTAGIVITAEAHGKDTTVSIEEAPLRGAARLVHNPALDLLIKLRNVETLRRLESVARRR